MSIAFYFTARGKTLQLPLNPAELTVTRQSGNQTAEVVSIGEINLLRDARLADISLEFLLPGSPGGLSLSGWQSPESYVSFFQNALEGKQALRLVVSGCGINMKMGVESFEHTRSAGDHDSVTCRLQLKQYRGYGAETLSDGSFESQFTATTREVDKPQNSSYTIKSGDSLWAIAQRELGSGTRYNEIASLNGIDPSQYIHPGQVLRIPGR